MKPTEALKKAIEKAGGMTKLARKVGVTPQCVNGWVARKRVPPEQCVRIEAVTGVSRRQLRPDIFA